MAITIRFKQQSWLKQVPIQASELPEAAKAAMPQGEELELHSYGPEERGHRKIALSKARFHGQNTWFVFAPHVEIYDGTKRVAPPAIAASVRLSVPYKSQRDNAENPSGSCNVTSLAMCLEFVGVGKQTGAVQFEDELYRYAIANGLSRHSPHDLALIAQRYGAKDEFRADATIDMVKAHLSGGNPCITHGYFTDFGHIVALVGYDANGFLAHDPWGEWNAWGYDRNDPNGNNEKGKYVHYSYDLIRRVCMPDGSFWVHFVSK